MALQQVARNAVMHRSYEHTYAPVRITWYDRVEIAGPGGPYGVVAPENFGDPGVTDYRRISPSLTPSGRARQSRDNLVSLPGDLALSRL